MFLSEMTQILFFIFRLLSIQGCLYFPAPGLGPGPRSSICIYRSKPPICIYWPWPPVCITPGPVFVSNGPGPRFARLPVLAPYLYLQTLVYNIITSPGPEFSIYRPCLFNLCLYLRSWPTICITNLILLVILVI